VNIRFEYAIAGPTPEQDGRMKGRLATAPNGREWLVYREWLHRPPRWRGWWPGRKRDRDAAKRGGSWADGLDPGCMPDELGLLMAIVAIAVVALLLWFLVLPALIFLADLLFLLIVAALAVAGRVLFRRPWTIVAESEQSPAARIEIPVVGWRASNTKLSEIVHDIRTTGTPTPR
jgi:hypothetical protein